MIAVRLALHLMLIVSCSPLLLASGAAHGETVATDVTVDDPVHQASQAVQQFHARLLAVAAQQDAVAKRFELLLPAVAAVFNTPTIARLSLGRSWSTLDSGNRAEFARRLERLIAATYADRFGYGTQVRFDACAGEPGRRGPLIRCQLVRPAGATVSLDYHFRDGKIYNVVADGVSDLSLRRADYNTVVKQQGFAALLDHIRTQQETLVGNDAPSATITGANS